MANPTITLISIWISDDHRIMIFIKPKALEDFLLIQDYDESILLMMSSGNYGGISWDNLKEQFS